MTQSGRFHKTKESISKRMIAWFDIYKIDYYLCFVFCCLVLI
jgi:hypothetical protein